MTSFKYDLKIVLLGKENSGKTSLVERFTKNIYEEDKSCTLGAAFAAQTIEVSGHSFTLGIWDTAGTERFESITKMYYRHANFALICYDVTSRASFERMRYWADEVHRNEASCKIIIVGTKVDLVENGIDRVVTTDEVTTFAEQIHAINIFETSAKAGTGISDIFTYICKHFWETRNNNTDNSSTRSGTVDIDKKKEGKTKSCCQN